MSLPVNSMVFSFDNSDNIRIEVSVVVPAMFAISLLVKLESIVFLSSLNPYASTSKIMAPAILSLTCYAVRLILSEHHALKYHLQ